MTNIQLIKFNAKYKLNYVNNRYQLSGFSHMESIHLNEYQINEVLDAIPDMNEEEFKDYCQYVKSEGF